MGEVHTICVVLESLMGSIQDIIDASLAETYDTLFVTHCELQGLAQGLVTLRVTCHTRQFDDYRPHVNQTISDMEQIGSVIIASSAILSNVQLTHRAMYCLSQSLRQIKGKIPYELLHEEIRVCRPKFLVCRDRLSCLTYAAHLKLHQYTKRLLWRTFSSQVVSGNTLFTLGISVRKCCSLNSILRELPLLRLRIQNNNWSSCVIDFKGKRDFRIWVESPAGYEECRLLVVARTERTWASESAMIIALETDKGGSNSVDLGQPIWLKKLSLGIASLCLGLMVLEAAPYQPK